jgi:2-(3-amino-3-carboxypropyl)histidine synthase
MKTLYIEARKKLKLDKEKLKELERMLPNALYVVYSIQYKELAGQVKEELEKTKTRKITGFSQVLGCSELKTTAQAILLIGQGKFHALNLALNSGKEVWIFDNYSINKIEKQEIEKLRNLEKGKYLKLLASNSIGVIVSSKPGQENLNPGFKLKKKLEKKGKKAYIFLADTINTPELENFPLDVWVNTACPGFSLDSPRVINSSAIKIPSIS